MSDFTDSPPPERKPPRGSEETDFPIPAQPPPLAKDGGRERAITIIAAAIVAALVAVVLVFGLQSFQANVPRQETLPQQGEMTVPAGETVDVFFPIPYVSPPNVTLSGSFADDVVISDQKADSFKLKNRSKSFSRSVHWRAEGRPVR